jgi:hypothetical protein
VTTALGAISQPIGVGLRRSQVSRNPPIYRSLVRHAAHARPALFSIAYKERCCQKRSTAQIAEQEAPMYIRQFLTLTTAMLVTVLALGIVDGSIPAEAAADVRASETRQATETSSPFDVSAEIALRSLMSIGDGHIEKMADSLQILAHTAEARSGNWDAIEPLLADVAERNVPALNWYAMPDGSYWSVQQGRESGTLADRDYFPRVLDGETAVGELVISRATGKPVAIVAVPARDEAGDVRGVLGASIYLDQLSTRIQEEMGLDESVIFYSFDEQPLVGLNWDPHLVFFEPMAAGEDDLVRAFRYMLDRDQGQVAYMFRDHERSVIFRKSPVTQWWYAFGVVPEGREQPQPYTGHRD